MEVWKDVVGYEGHYQVSSFGNVRTIKKGIVKEKAKTDGGLGYYVVCLCKDGKCINKRVHQLVAIAFLDKDYLSKGLVVDHLDDDKKNNNLSNLKITTIRDNTCRNQSRYSSKFKGVSYDKKSKLYVALIRIDGKLKYLGCYKCELKAALAYQNELKKL